LLFREPAETLEVPNGGSLRERFDAVYDLMPELFALREDGLLCDDRKFSEGDEQKLLETRDSTSARIGGVWMC
jgi:hypothetical protein